MEWDAPDGSSALSVLPEYFWASVLTLERRQREMTGDLACSLTLVREIMPPCSPPTSGVLEPAATSSEVQTISVSSQLLNPTCNITLVA